MFKSASLFKFKIELSSLLTIRRSNNTTDTWTLYYGVSGTNMSAVTFYYIRYEDADDCQFYDDAAFTRKSDTDFIINNVKAENGFWEFPDTHYFNTHYYDARNALASQLGDFLDTKPYIKVDGETGKTGQVIHYDDIGNSGYGYAPNLEKSLKYVKAQISGPNLVSQGYTYEWLSGLKNNGEYHGPAHNISDRNGSTIPTGWTTYSS
jgi:hypothetical protein